MGCHNSSRARSSRCCCSTSKAGMRCGSCGRRYPIVDGVALMLPDLSRLSEVGPQLAPEVEAVLAQDGPDDAPLSHLLEHLSIYMDAHWGDRAEPGPDGPGAGFGL